jgi:hypothetical protein
MMKKLNPIEDYLDLVTLGRIEKDGQKAGFYILGLDSKNSHLSKITIKFSFTCQGIHSLPRSSQQFETINKALTAGFKEIQDSTFTIRWSSFCGNNSSADKQAKLDTVSKESFYFDIAQKARNQELTKKKSAKK